MKKESSRKYVHLMTGKINTGDWLLFFLTFESTVGKGIDLRECVEERLRGGPQKPPK